MHGSNDKSDDILDKALEDIVNEEESKAPEQDMNSAEDEWLDGIFEEEHDATPSSEKKETIPSDNAPTISLEDEMFAGNGDVDSMLDASGEIAEVEKQISPDTPKSEEASSMDEIGEDISGGLDDFLDGENTTDTNDDIDAMLDDEPTVDPVSDDLDGDDDIDAMLDDEPTVDPDGDIDALLGEDEPAADVDDLLDDDVDSLFDEEPTSDVTGADEDILDLGLEDESEGNSQDDDIDELLGNDDNGQQVEDDDIGEDEIDDLLSDPEPATDNYEHEEESDIDDLLSGFNEETFYDADDADDASENPNDSAPQLKGADDLDRIVSSAESEEKSVPEDTDKSDVIAKSKDEDEEVKKGKFGLAGGIALVLLAGAAGIAGGSFGPSLLSSAGIDVEHGGSNEETVLLQRDVRELKKQVLDLEGQLAVVEGNSNAVVSLTSSVSKIQKTQMAFSSQQDSMNQELDKMNSGMDDFQNEVVKRIESLLDLVGSASIDQDVVSSEIRETVLREVVQLIEDGGFNGMDKKVLDALKEFESTSMRLSQVEDWLKGVRNLTTMNSAEQDYLSSRLSKVESAIKNGSSTPTYEAQQVEVKQAPPVIKPVEVYVDTQSQVKTKNKLADEQVKNEPVKPAKQYVLGVHEISTNNYTIYLQEEGASGNAFKPYTFSSGSVSIVPGYGRITGVRKSHDPSKMIDDVVDTESGVITGKPRG